MTQSKSCLDNFCLLILIFLKIDFIDTETVMSEIRLKIAMNEPRKAILNQFLLKANEDLSLGYFNLEETARNLSFT